jgi:hypothetical protein
LNKQKYKKNVPSKKKIYLINDYGIVICDNGCLMKAWLFMVLLFDDDDESEIQMEFLNKSKVRLVTIHS